jgi:hypothetical protein
MMANRKDQTRKTAMIHAFIDADTRQRLDVLAYERREPLSELLREALASYLANPPRDVRPPPSPVTTSGVA